MVVSLVGHWVRRWLGAGVTFSEVDSSSLLGDDSGRTEERDRAVGILLIGSFQVM